MEPPSKRKRSVVSCTECHRRKQKCDRQQPCQRCIRREMPTQCYYELPDTQAMVVDDDPTDLAATSASQSLSGRTSSLKGAVSSSSTTSDYLVCKNMGYAPANIGTLSIIQSLGAMTVEPSENFPSPSGDAVAQFRALMRQLPPQRHINTLVSFFYRELSWQYEIVDENIFRQQLSSWNQVPYAARNQPFHLSPDLRQFPALLFQLLAEALLFQPMRYDESLEDLRHAPGMDLADVAAEFSDAGQQVSAVFGPSEATMVKVQAGLLRACFEKNTGLVAEAWHTLGQTIRDAQELGLHRLTLSDEFSADQGNQARAGRKLWLILHLWDGHMAVVLGRPMVTDLDPESAPSPDCQPNQANEDSDSISITPFNMILCGYNVAYRYLRDIHDLNSTTPPNIGDKVDAIHSEIMQNLDHIPSWAKLNPQDQDSNYPWLHAARETLHTEVHFTLLALHRPFIFRQPHSRIQAFTAATRVLESQSRLFALTEPRQYPAFGLVFATFDAAVIVAATHIIFPQENQEQLDSSLKNLQWSLERFFVMKRQNRLAGVAHVVVKAMYGKVLNTTLAFQSALQQNWAAEGEPTGQTQHSFAYETSSDDMQQILAVSQRVHGIMSPQPLRDLVFQDSTAGLQPMEVMACSPEHFPEQAVTDDEFWRIINSLG
ncbi:hypothetical protein LMH87_009250 [Akanthomyces muscarius]|uniref:Zn(2)-C6 fungal-type domain-containing protein n=1 Tax=Akanthomyces muscarius TaxID=2231603 RepID=A0A9W8ULY9_AKAMU|nr:hypothetical protein LMH87_009250 [Akanthomyces muscarius]KAJ4152727.1 hypothetical protein LMH87_009250 [Akanthomyces muscarius]